MSERIPTADLVCLLQSELHAINIMTTDPEQAAYCDFMMLMSQE